MKFRTSGLLAVLLLALSFGAAAVDQIKQGVDYEVLAKPQPTETGDKIEVLELFWYGCPHCFKLEPFFEDWLGHLPDEVAFRRMPAIFNKTWELNAQGYYTAEALGVLDQTHRPLFDAIHLHNRKLFDENALAAFFAEQGVSKDDFHKTFNSFAVKTKTSRAKSLTPRYGITGVPAVIVNGKYRTSAVMAGGEERLMRVIDALIALEKAGVH